MFGRSDKEASPKPADTAGSFIELTCPDEAALGRDVNCTDRAERIYQTGHKVLVRGFYAEALALFERATGYDRAHYGAYVAQTEALILLGRTEEAARVANDAMERYGRNCALGAARGHVFLHQNDVDQALECAEIAVQNDPRSAYAWLIAGEARVVSGAGLPQLMNCFMRSSACDAFWPHLNIRISLAFLEWGHAAHALRSLEDIVRDEPNLPLAWMLLGDACRKEGLGRQARASYRRAAELAPDLASARRALSWRMRIEDAWRTLQDTIRRR
jgi:tetratricopeptide (TPR) repeat protein